MADEIIVEIDQKGSSKITVKGVKGSSCKQLTRDLERALGKTTESHTTAEYHEQPLRERVRQR